MKLNTLLMGFYIDIEHLVLRDAASGFNIASYFWKASLWTLSGSVDKCEAYGA